MSWKALITDAGNELSAKTISGGNIKLTHAKAGSGTISEQDLHLQTELVNVKQTLSIESIKYSNAVNNIEILLDCRGLKEAYDLTQIGIYATDPDAGEILFAIAQTENPKHIPAENEVPFYSIDFNFAFALKNNQNMVATIDQSTFATKEQLSAVDARIDNIIVNAGSTEDNAELIDMRVDVDGKRHSTAGEALRSQLKQKANLTDISSPYQFRGACLSANLPGSGNKINDTYYVTDKKCKFTWNGAAWYQSSLNESDYEEELSSITEDLDSVVEVTHSKNLLDVSKLHNGFLQNNGTISVADWALDYWYTDKIPCTKSDIIFANGTGNPQNQLGGLYKNGKWVAPLSSNATILKTQDESEKAYYFKIVFSEVCPDFDAIILNTLHLEKFEKKFVMLNCIEPDVYSQYDIFRTSKMISKDVKAQAITESLMDEIKKTINAKIPNVINCWGNSLTFGYGATDRNTESYPKVLQKLLSDKYTVNNYAVSGEGAQQIASRQGGSLAYVQPCTIPANGSVNIVLKDLVGTSISLLNQGDAGVNPCYINGIKGTLSKNGSNMVFTRSENGDVVEIMHPVPLITDANKNARDGIIIIWCGSNNRTYFNNSPTIEKNEVHNIIRCIKTMIKHTNCGGKYIVIGLTSKAYMSQVETVNKAFATEFGEHFLDVRSNILLAGLKESRITPTEQDNTDIENGEIPSSLRIDDIHFNTKGYALIAQYVYEHGKILGYW